MKEHTDTNHLLKLIMAFSAATFVFSVFGYVTTRQATVSPSMHVSVSRPMPMAAKADSDDIYNRCNWFAGDMNRANEGAARTTGELRDMYVAEYNQAQQNWNDLGCDSVYPPSAN